ncbi:MAG: SH3 domain-containing protein [Bdellovibrio sp.]
MKALKSKQSVVVLLGILTSQVIMAANTADYYKCTNREGGEWNFGRAPQACSASAFGSDSYLNTNFGSLIFQDSASRNNERVRYMGEMHAVVRDGALSYLKKKKPKATNEEVNAFVQAMITTASHESYFSMYRKASDARLKMMRGDSGHGHGLMQIDDRAHFNAVTNGLAWNLATHLTYAMDVYYAAWQNAASASCVTNASNYWQARTRSAWSAYNGGPKKLCRWTDPNSAWAHNDRNFYAMLTGKKWKGFVEDEKQKSSVPIACLMEKKEDCAAETEDTSNRPVEGHLYRIEGQVCLVKNQIFFCLAEKDRQCLSAVGTIANQTVIPWTKEQVSQYGIQQQDRHGLCEEYDRQLVAVSSGLKVLKNINMRDTPAGGLVSVIPKGAVLHVRDFEIREVAGDRYYKVIYGGKVGYVYAGSKADASSWAVEASSSLAPKSTLARVSDSIKVINAYGINLRATPGGTQIVNIPKGVTVKVLESLVKGADDKLYYKVTYGKYTGYVHAGVLSPEETLESWATAL